MCAAVLVEGDIYGTESSFEVAFFTTAVYMPL